MEPPLPEPDPQHHQIVHVARLVGRHEVIDTAVTHIARALGEEYRLLVVHADALDGSALNLALEEAGINLPFRSGPVELSHNVGSGDVLAAAAERTLLYRGGHLRVVCLASHAMPLTPSGLCLPVEGLQQLEEVECFFTVEQPTGEAISRMLGHDAAAINGIRLPLSPLSGRLAVLGALLEAARRSETVDRLLAHPGFAGLGDVVLGHLAAVHHERIGQRHDLATLRGQLTAERREKDAALVERDRRVEIDERILGTDGDINALLTLASAELGVGLILEDETFESLRSSEQPAPPPLRSLLDGRIDTIALDLEPGVPRLVRLGRPSDGSRLVMRLAVDRRLGYLSILLAGVRETDLQRSWLERLRASLAAARRVEVEMSEVAGRVGRHILRELVTGSLSPVESRSAASQLGWMQGYGSALVVLTVADGRRDEVDNHLSTLCDRLNRGPFTATVVDDEIAVLCLSLDDIRSLETMAAETEGVVVGVGALDDHPELAHQARRQASWAARLARANRRASLHFGDIGIHRLLLPGSEGGDPEFEAPIRRLEEHAPNLGFDPVETLRVYRNSGASAREAADILNLHVNTLRYRIRRIATLSELDLNDPEQRFQADLALRLRTARRAFDSGNG